jgi:hypothetical protein
MPMTGELLARLQPWYDEDIAARVLSANNHPTGNFGTRITNTQAIVAHVTAGWPQRAKGESFFERYTNGNAGPPNDPGKAGFGTQLYVAGDGSVRRVFDLTGTTFHASHFNDRSVGVETGNTANDVRLQPPGNGWEAASSDTADFAGMKLWLTINNPDEFAASWFTTSGYTGPGFLNLPAGLMLFSEAQYQSWALLTRYLLELFTLPRNFPVLPHRREVESHDGVTAAAAARRIILCDQTSEMMQRKLIKSPFQFATTDFTNPTTFQQKYDAESVGAAGTTRAFNRVWREFTYMFRGLVGHHFCGNSKGPDKAECPGKVFDFHRLAREVWDYWWYPFDTTSAGGTATPRRAYRVFREGTPLIEYYWEESEAQHKARLTPGIHGGTGAPSTFGLDPVSPIYALANGELVAARFPTEPGGGFAPASMAFVLVRHEVFHRNRFPWNLFPSTSPLPPAFSPALIDYNQKPDYVYSLYMHLDRPAGMDLDDFSDDNPDWLNRVLLRKKECQLGLSFYARDQQNHHITTRAWENRPPGTPARPTTLESWRADDIGLDAFLTALRSGDVAVPPRDRWHQPVRVLLGDFLGNSGIIRHTSTSAPEYGIRVEVFSPSFVAPGFRHVTDQPNWNPPAGGPACVEFHSEWASAPDAAERARLEAIGVDPALVNWWLAVAVCQALDSSLPAEARLPLLPIFGKVIHYELFSFMAWLNRHTWEHEWPKFGILDASNNPIPTPTLLPNSRRI